MLAIIRLTAAINLGPSLPQRFISLTPTSPLKMRPVVLRLIPGRILPTAPLLKHQASF